MLSRGKVESVNPIVRWHQIKELHCDQLRKIVAYHFLSQRTGLAEQPESEAQERYAKQVFLLQKILTANMQAKQKTDPSSVRDLRALLRKFQAAYFSDPDAEGMDIQDSPDQRID